MTEQYAWVNAVGEVAVTDDGEAPEHGSWERLVPKVKLDQALAKQPGWSARDVLDRVAQALDTPVRVDQLAFEDVDAMLNHVLAVVSMRTEAARAMELRPVLDQIAEAVDSNIRSDQFTDTSALLSHVVGMVGLRNEQAQKWKQVVAMTEESN